MTHSVVKVAALTAATMAIFAGICFYFFYRHVMAKRKRIVQTPSFRREPVIDTQELRQQGGTLKGVLVEENGLEVVYLRKLEGRQLRSSVSRIWFNPMEEVEKRVDIAQDKHKTVEAIHEVTLTQQPSNTVEFSKPKKTIPQHFQAKKMSNPTPTLQYPHTPPEVPVKAPPQPSAPPPPPPPPTRPPLTPPPLLPVAAVPRKITTKTPSPVITTRRNPKAPPPLLHSGGFGSSLKPPAAPRGKVRTEDQTEESLKGNHDLPKKMKPFHWEKVNTNADHSVVWNELVDGSFRFDDDLIEALFGYTNRKSAEAKYLSHGSGSSNSTASAQISILDPRKSQNTAIVLKSLAMSHKEILDALIEGRGLNGDILEKLENISPNEEEVSKILQFNGNPTKLQDAESFLYHVLKAIPSAFLRIKAMLFRSNYDPEILHLKESLQTLELGCKELRARGIFLKLLEAILKAGNRMNAGTARGNAKGFNLSALRKLSYVKSTDGKTTLLHFVVEQVVRAEGKRCDINKNQRLGRRNNEDRSSNQDSDTMIAKEEKEKEYLMLGLPLLGGLSTNFSNVRKAATIDYDSFISMSPNLTARVNEIRELVTQCGASERGGFVKEMKGFLEECEEELKVVRDEQKRVMELVKRTTDFYQAGYSKDKGGHPLQIFGFVKDFLDMVDQVCVDLTRKVQKKNAKSLGLSSPPVSPSARTSTMFQNLQLYFKPESTRPADSSDSEDDF